jgi:hypothetical protein
VGEIPCHPAGRHAVQGFARNDYFWDFLRDYQKWIEKNKES